MIHSCRLFTVLQLQWKDLVWDKAVIRNFNNEGQLLSGTAYQFGLRSGMMSF